MARRSVHLTDSHWATSDAEHTGHPPRRHPNQLLKDRGYASDPLRKRLAACGSVLTVPIVPTRSVDRLKASWGRRTHHRLVRGVPPSDRPIQTDHSEGSRVLSIRRSAHCTAEVMTPGSRAHTYERRDHRRSSNARHAGAGFRARGAGTHSVRGSSQAVAYAE